MIKHGWFQVAFKRDLTKEITPVDIGDRQLIIINRDNELSVYDAFCPHRGAHLGHSGCLKSSGIKCDFHGLMVGLGDESEHALSIKKHHTLEMGGLLFVRLSESFDNGFSDMLHAISKNHYFVPGFNIEVDVPYSMVPENAFDSGHFHTVHKILNHPEFVFCAPQNGEFKVKGEFVVPKSRWHVNATTEGDQSIQFSVAAYSPGVIVAQMQGEDPYRVITCATPKKEGGCSVFLSLAVPAQRDGSPPNEALCHYLLEKSHAGLGQDKIIWQHMNHTLPPQYVENDNAVIGFRTFCRDFEMANES